MGNVQEQEQKNYGGYANNASIMSTMKNKEKTMIKELNDKINIGADCEERERMKLDDSRGFEGLNKGLSR